MWGSTEGGEKAPRRLAEEEEREKEIVSECAVERGASGGRLR